MTGIMAYHQSRIGTWTKRVFRWVEGERTVAGNTFLYATIRSAIAFIVITLS
jgi:hypothetical protein